MSEIETLLREIVENVGVPIPKYSYGYKKYTIEVPQNIETGGGVTGIERMDMFDTFQEACKAIIEWHETI